MNTIKLFLIKNITVLAILGMGLLILPFQVLAQPQTLPANQNLSSSTPQCQSLIGGDIDNLKDVIDWATCMIVDSIVPLLWILAFVVFIYGVIQYFLNPNNINEREKARQYIIWALVGMFVIFTIGGIVDLIRNTFGVSGSTLPLLPETQ
jgi:hypothetical protein